MVGEQAAGQRSAEAPRPTPSDPAGGAPPSSRATPDRFTALAALAAELAGLDPARSGGVDDAVTAVARACGLGPAQMLEVDLRSAPVQDVARRGGPALALAREAVRRDGLVRTDGRLAVPVEGGALVAEAGPVDEALLAAAAVQLGVVVRRCREAQAGRAAGEAATRADARLELLAGAGRVLASSLDEAEALGALARLLVPALADWCTVHLVDPGGRAVRRVAVAADTDDRRALLDEVEQLIPPTPADDFGVGRVLRSGAPHVSTVLPGLPDAGPGTRLPRVVRDDPEAEVRELLDALGTRSVVDVPIPSLRPEGGGRPLGVLTLARRRDDALGVEDVGLASELAQRAAMAVSNARAYREARATALTLQRSLLPHSLPDVPGLSLASSYQPAGTSEVGGDWYDAVPLPDGRVGLAIGDVMGRGVRAAALMGQLRATLRSYALEGHPPAEVVGRLDRVVEVLDVGFATCLYATLDPRTGDLEVAAAGHLPPLVLRTDGSAELVPVDPGLPLGAGPSTPEPTRLHLAPGEAVVLFTDGLVESREQPVGEGLALLERRAVRLPREPARTLDVLLDRLDPRSGDDTALLVVARDDGTPEEHAPATDAAADPADDLEHHALPPGPEAPSRARAVVREALARWGLGGAVDTLLLLTTELVTNAVRHGLSSPHLSLQRAGSRVRVSVSDTGPRRALLARDPGSSAEGGRGLWLVEMMAADWGVADPEPGRVPPEDPTDEPEQARPERATRDAEVLRLPTGRTPGGRAPAPTAMGEGSDEGGKTVWFTVDLPDAPNPPAPES